MLVIIAIKRLPFVLLVRAIGDITGWHRVHTLQSSCIFEVSTCPVDSEARSCGGKLSGRRNVKETTHEHQKLRRIAGNNEVMKDIL